MLFSGGKFTTVDIGSHSIKVARMKKVKCRLTLLAAAMRQLPFATIKDGLIEDSSIIARNLEAIFDEMGYRPRKIITTLSSNNLLTRNMEFPSMSEEELMEAIKWEAEDYLPFTVEKATIDYLILNRDEEKIDVLLVAVKEEVLNNYLLPFKKIGIKPAVVNIQPMALLSLLAYQGQITKPLAVIDIGASSTRVVIGDQKNIYFSRTIDIGGGSFTRSIIESRGIDYNDAESLKIEKGIKKVAERAEKKTFDLDLIQLTSNTDGGQLFSQAINLTEELSRSLDFFSMKNRGQSIEDVYITGGGCRLKGLQKVITGELNLELKLLNPFSDIKLQTSLSDEMKEEFSVAIGLGISEVLVNEG